MLMGISCRKVKGSGPYQICPCRTRARQGGGRRRSTGLPGWRRGSSTRLNAFDGLDGDDRRFGTNTAENRRERNGPPIAPDPKRISPASGSRWRRVEEKRAVAEKTRHRRGKSLARGPGRRRKSMPVSETGRDVEGPAQGDHQMREIPAHAKSRLVSVSTAEGRVGGGRLELDVPTHSVEWRAPGHSPAAGGRIPHCHIVAIDRTITARGTGQHVGFGRWRPPAPRGSSRRRQWWFSSTVALL